MIVSQFPSKSKVLEFNNIIVLSYFKIPIFHLQILSYIPSNTTMLVPFLSIVYGNVLYQYVSFSINQKLPQVPISQYTENNNTLRNRLLLQGLPYNPKLYDIWSMGCILYVMLKAQMPFDDTNVKKMLKFQQNRMICYTIYYEMKISSDLKKLLTCVYYFIRLFQFTETKHIFILVIF